MKKLLLILLVLFSLVSCKMQILDPDGWAIYQMGWAISENQILIQSHDGFIINDVFYNEAIEEDNVVIINALNHSIDVKITEAYKNEWIIIPENSQQEYVYNNEEEIWEKL